MLGTENQESPLDSITETTPEKVISLPRTPSPVEDLLAQIQPEKPYVDPTQDSRLMQKMQDAYLKFLLQTVCGVCKGEVDQRRKVKYQGGVLHPECHIRHLRSQRTAAKPVDLTSVSVLHTAAERGRK